jgi:hypothetical protein
MRRFVLAMPARIHGSPVGSIHWCRGHRLAVVLRRCGQRDCREVGAAGRCDFIAGARPPGLPAQPSPPAVQAAAAKTAALQPAPLAQTAREGVAPAAAEQLKAGQEQMARVIAKASEHSLRPKISALPPRPTAPRRASRCRPSDDPRRWPSRPPSTIPNTSFGPH